MTYQEHLLILANGAVRMDYTFTAVRQHLNNMAKKYDHSIERVRSDFERAYVIAKDNTALPEPVVTRLYADEL